MKFNPRDWVFAAALIPHDAPLASRIEILGKYLTPAPTKMAEVDEAQLRDNAPLAKDPAKIYGMIRVTPPKGSCFTVTVAKDRQDVEVCKPTSLMWRLEDLDFEKSSFTWIIKTAPGDFGTPVTWKTPYSIAKIMPYNTEFFRYNSTPVFFKSCVPAKATAEGMPRKLTLTLFNNKRWLIRFPDIDTPLAPKTAEAVATNADESKKNGEGGEKKTEPVKPKEPVEEPEQWTINTGRAFEMSVDNIITDGPMPPGNKGTCRYVYDYYPGDKSLGRIECHHGGPFLYFYAFLRCMNPISPK